MKPNNYAEAFATAERSPEFWAETLALQFISEVWQVMQDREISQKDLAERLGKKPAFISRVLSGPQNLTLKTIAEFLVAVDLGAKLEFSEIGVKTDAADEVFANNTTVINVPNRKYRAVETIIKNRVEEPANSSIYEVAAA